MQVGKYDVTPKNVGSFFRGMRNKFGRDLGFKTLTASQQNQVTLRSLICSDCTSAGHCKGCNCMTPHMYYDPLKEDHYNKWGQMMDEQTWQNFLKGKEELTPEQLAKAYQEVYKEARTLNVTITPHGAILGPQVRSDISNDVQAQTDDSVAPATAKEVLMIPADRTKMRIGHMVTGQTATCAFTLTNTTDDQIQIRSVGVSCGCTVPAFDKGLISPGESFAITLSYTAQNPGVNIKTATVAFDKVENVVLTIEANVTQ